MDGGVEGDGWLYDGGVRMRLESSSPSLSSSTLHLCFLVRLAGGDIGGGVSGGAGCGDGGRATWATTAAFAVVCRNCLHRKPAVQCHALVSGLVIDRNTCSVARGDANVI
jgi:hypothetical protein